MMKNWKRMLASALTVMMMTGLASAPAYAATKVSTISLEIESDIEIGNEYSVDEVTILTKSDKYVIGEVEFTNDGYEWESTDTPVIEVYVEAAEGYSLSLTTKNIKIKGATYVSGKKVDSQTVLLTLRLPSLRENVGEIESAEWQSSCVGEWAEAYNVGTYEVKLYRDGKSVKTTQKTSSTTMDFSSMMTKAGSYNYRVRAVNSVKEENKSEWLDSSEVFIDEETASQMRATYGNVTSGQTEPGQAAASQVKDGWNQDGTGWWYRNQDGTYAVNNWQYINDKWYFFNSKGYMQTGWVLWNHQYYYCDDASAHMLVSTTVPDGSRVDSSGVWIQ